MAKVIAGLLLGATLAAVPATESRADCTCRAQGRDFDLGRSICMMTPSGYRLATCDMVLNNTSWKISSTPCVDAFVPPNHPLSDRPHRVTRDHRHRHGG